MYRTTAAAEGATTGRIKHGFASARETHCARRLIARRQHTGAPSPQQVSAQREELLRLKDEHDRDAQAIEARIAEARARCIARSAEAMSQV